MSSNTDVSSAPSAADILTGLSCVNTARSSACGGFVAGPTLAAIELTFCSNLRLNYNRNRGNSGLTAPPGAEIYRIKIPPRWCLTGR